MSRMKCRILAGFLPLFLVTVMGVGGMALAQEAFPTKPIEIIVPFAPGGATDLVDRILAAALSKKWGVPVNVINKPGGNSVLGQIDVYKAKPDGYTVLGDAGSTSSYLGVGTQDLPFKIMDRTFIAMATTSANVFVVAPKSPFKNLTEVMAEIKKDPGKFTWAMHGSGTDSTGLVFKKLFKEIGVDPQKTKAISVAGGGPGITLVAGGNAIMGCPTLGAAVNPLSGGIVRALAVTTKSRNPDWPDVPTTAELGYPNITGLWWAGISGPPKMNAAVVAKWEQGLDEILKDPEVVAKLRKLGQTISYLNAKATREYVIKETDEVYKAFEMVNPNR